MHDHAGDDELLGMLGQLGIDLAKPREVIFYFLFPTEAAADGARSVLAEKKLESEKFKTDVPWWKRLFAQPQWLVSTSQTMPLDETSIKRRTTEFQQIATRHGGSYDGWEANVMDDNIDPDRLNQIG